MSGASTPQADATFDEVRGVHLARAVPLGPPSADMLDQIRAHVVDPAILDEHEPFVWQAQASNANEDAYATVMDRSTLDNFATDAQSGVAFMNSHRTGGMMSMAELPMGRTFDGKVVGASANGPLRLDVTAYTLRGLNLTGLSTDSFIDGMRSGIARDVSVGFYGGEYRCSICQRDMLRDWECRHYPGLSYPKLDSKGQPVEGETVRATARIVGAHLAEVSAVYDGATPGCMVSKAVRMAEAGALKADAITLLEQRYRINLPHPARSFAGVEMPTASREEAMPTDPIEGAAAPDLSAADLAVVRLALTEVGATPDAPLTDAIRTLVDEVRGLRALTAEVERLKPFEDEAVRLRPLADEGRAYRADLVEAAVIEGKRALGEAFAEETYRGLLTSVPTETVKRMRDDWRAIAAKTFVGGRATIEGHEPPNGSITHAEIPSAAYAG